MMRHRQDEYRRAIERARTAPLNDLDRRVVRAIVAGVHPVARDLAKALGVGSFETTHISLIRLQAHGIVLAEHGKQGATRLAPNIVVVKDEVFRLERIAP